MILFRSFRQPSRLWQVNPERGKRLLCQSETGSHFACGEYIELLILIHISKGGGCMSEGPRYFNWSRWTEVMELRKYKFLSFHMMKSFLMRIGHWLAGRPCPGVLRRLCVFSYRWCLSLQSRVQVAFSNRWQFCQHGSRYQPAPCIRVSGLRKTPITRDRSLCHSALFSSFVTARTQNLCCRILDKRPT